MSGSILHVREVEGPRQLPQFVTFPWQIYRGDCNWVPPLIFRRVAYLDPTKSAFFQEGEARLFTDWCDGRIVGTIASAINHFENECHQRSVGVLGFFECIQDYYVAEALFETGRGWPCPI
jgi:hypothetical protein